MAFVEFQRKHKTVFGLVDPTGTGTVNSDFVAMGKAHHATFVIMAGTLGNDVVLTIREALLTGAAPGGDKAIAGKTVTMGVGESDSVEILEVEASEMDVAGGFKTLSVRSAAVGACDISVAIILWPTRYKTLA
jgi:hypothetical protein